MEQLSLIKNSVKKDTNKATVGIIVYTAIMTVVVLVHAIVATVIQIIKDPKLFLNPDGEAFEAFVGRLAESALSTIIGVAAGVLFLSLFFKKDHLFKRIFVSSKRMSLTGFLELMCVFLGIQFVFSILVSVTETLLNCLGLTSLAGIETATGTSSTVSMFMYISFIAPIVEELVFRGFILRKLEPHGKVFAIAVSSVLFGFMHMNIYQNIFGVLIGFILGYTAIEYGIKWAIALHMINNFVFGELFNKLTATLSDETQSIILLAVELVLFLGAILITVLKRAKIKAYITENRITDNKLKHAFTTVSIIIYLIVCVLFSFLGISKI